MISASGHAADITTEALLEAILNLINMHATTERPTHHFHRSFINVILLATAFIHAQIEAPAFFL